MLLALPLVAMVVAGPAAAGNEPVWWSSDGQGASPDGTDESEWWSNHANWLRDLGASWEHDLPGDGDSVYISRPCPV